MKTNLLCRLSPYLLTAGLTLAVYSCGKTPATAGQPNREAANPSVTSNVTEAVITSALVPTTPAFNSNSAAEQNTVRPSVVEGDYAMGGTDQGLEVRGNQYRYYDELGEQDWRPTSQLTVVGPGHVFDGENYWCHSDKVPEGGGICTADGWQSYSSVGTITSDELSLGGVAAGAAAAAVIDQLGQPDQIDQDSPFSSRFTYRGLSVSFFEDAALTIRSVSPDYCTPLGLCPGDAVAVAEHLYGAPIVDPRTDADYWQYTNTEAACTVELEVTNETIGAIAILCQI